MYLDPDLRLGELALRVSGVLETVRAHDLPVAEHETLRQLCSREGVAIDGVMAALHRAAEEESTTGLQGLVRYILRVHHDFERRELPRLRGLAVGAARRHGDGHPELHQVADLVGNLEDELEAHLAREERVLFPYLVELEKAARGDGPRPAPKFRTLRNPLKIMSAEHAVEESLLEALREATGSYGVPPDADEAWRELYDGLRLLDAELGQHMLLEDGVLFPLALALEVELGIV